MRHLVPIVKDAKDEGFVVVMVRGQRAPFRPHVQRPQFRRDRILHGEFPRDVGDRYVLRVHPEITRFVYELCKDLSGPDQVKKEFLQQLLSLGSVSSRQMAVIESEKLVKSPIGEGESFLDVISRDGGTHGEPVLPANRRSQFYQWIAWGLPAALLSFKPTKDPAVS